MEKGRTYIMDSLGVVWDYLGNFWWGKVGITHGGVGWPRKGYLLMVAVKLISCIQLYQVGLKFCKSESWSAQQVQQD